MKAADQDSGPAQSWRPAMIGGSMPMKFLGCVLACVLGLQAAAVTVQPKIDKVLIVVAHPDDEIVVAATTFRLAQELGGTVDQVVITNGEGGFHYATLAQRIYGLALTREPTGRRHLPRIRKAELLRAGRIMGVRKHYFLGQRDGSFTKDIGIPLAQDWNSERVRNRLHQILERGRYDCVFTCLPLEGTHGHHKAATVLALEAAARIPPARRPVILGAMLEHKDKAASWTYSALPGYPETRLKEEAPRFAFDRTRSLGHRNALNYQIISNWIIAEHKSQGTLQLLPARNYELETFRLYQTEVPLAAERVAELFRSLNGTTAGIPSSITPAPPSQDLDPMVGVISAPSGGP